MPDPPAVRVVGRPDLGYGQVVDPLAGQRQYGPPATDAQEEPFMTGRPTARPVTSLDAYRTAPTRLLMLVHRMAAADHDAFTRLYAALLPRVTATVRAVQPDPSRAEAAVSATFVEAWLAAEECTGTDTDVATWIDGIAVRLAEGPQPAHPPAAGHPSGRLTLPVLLGHPGRTDGSGGR